MKTSDIRIASPCGVDWQTMTPAEGGRFCGECKKVVRDLSSLTEKDARSLLARENNVELCVRYLYNRDGRVRFGEAGPEGTIIHAAFLKRAKRVAAAMALPLALAACSSPSTNAADDSSQNDPRRPGVEVDEDPHSTYNDLFVNQGGAPAYFPAEDRDAGADASVTPASASDGGHE